MRLAALGDKRQVLGGQRHRIVEAFSQTVAFPSSWTIVTSPVRPMVSPSPRPLSGFRLRLAVVDSVRLHDGLNSVSWVTWPDRSKRGRFGLAPATPQPSGRFNTMPGVKGRSGRKPKPSELNASRAIAAKSAALT